MYRKVITPKTKLVKILKCYPLFAMHGISVLESTLFSISTIKIGTSNCFPNHIFLILTCSWECFKN